MLRVDGQLSYIDDLEDLEAGVDGWWAGADADWWAERDFRLRGLLSDLLVLAAREDLWLDPRLGSPPAPLPLSPPPPVPPPADAAASQAAVPASVPVPVLTPPPLPKPPQSPSSPFSSLSVPPPPPSAPVCSSPSEAGVNPSRPCAVAADEIEVCLMGRPSSFHVSPSPSSSASPTLRTNPSATPTPAHGSSGPPPAPSPSTCSALVWCFVGVRRHRGWWHRWWLGLASLVYMLT